MYCSHYSLHVRLREINEIISVATYHPWLFEAIFFGVEYSCNLMLVPPKFRVLSVDGGSLLHNRYVFHSH